MPLQLTKKQGRNVFHLPIEQAVYVPSTIGEDKPISQKQFNSRVNEVRKYLGKTFGGYTSIRGVGGYVHSKKGLIRERAVKVTSFATKKDYSEHKTQLLRKLRGWGTNWGQDSMGYEYEGDLYYFPKLKKRRRK